MFLFFKAPNTFFILQKKNEGEAIKTALATTGKIFTIVFLAFLLLYALQYLKITEKVSFNILSGQKVIRNAKNGQLWRVFEILKLAVKQCYQTGQF